MGKKGKKGHFSKPISLDAFIAREAPPAQTIPDNYAKETLETKTGTEVEFLVSSLASQGALTSEEFHFCHFNHVETSPNVYLPCEVGIVKYSLDSGVSETYHNFIHPGKLPIGSAYEAKDYSDKTHRIPPYDFKLFDSDYILIIQSVESILRSQDGKLAPLYVLDEDIPKALFIVDWFDEKCHEQDPSYQSLSSIKIRSLNNLVYQLRCQVSENNPGLKFDSPIQVTRFLQSTSFTYHDNMSCKWHCDEDRTAYCSLAIARNYAYVISDLCCEHYGVQLLPDRHCPAALLDETRYELTSKMKSVSLKDSDGFQPASAKSQTARQPTRGRGSLLNN